MEGKPDISSPQIQSRGTKSVSADEKPKGISKETSATDGDSIASAVVSDVTPLSPRRMICHFSCKVCHDLAKEPVINVICGHLFCWSCLCRRLTPQDPEQRGFLRGCPFCKSHLDISPTMSTVIPVYSGPEPGVQFSPIVNPEPEPDEEKERKREEGIRREGKVYVAPRPALQNCSRYASKIDLVVDMLLKVYLARLEGKHDLKLMEEGLPMDGLILCQETRLDELIEQLKDGWLWLTGNENPRQPVKTNEGGLHIIFVPTDVQLPDISTFTCGICEETAFEPVVTICGHLFCWTCLWRETGGIYECQICNRDVNLFASRANINSIYCEPNDPSKEDETLKAIRTGFRQEIQAPCRPVQMLPASFLNHMIKNVDEGRTVIMKQLRNLQSSYHTLSGDQIEESFSKVNKTWDTLYADLVNGWRKSTAEQVKESEIQPTLLDFISKPRKKSDGGKGAVIEYWGYLSDYIGDTLID